MQDLLTEEYILNKMAPFELIRNKNEFETCISKCLEINKIDMPAGSGKCSIRAAECLECVVSYIKKNLEANWRKFWIYESIANSYSSSTAFHHLKKAINYWIEAYKISAETSNFMIEDIKEKINMLLKNDINLLLSIHNDLVGEKAANQMLMQKLDHNNRSIRENKQKLDELLYSPGNPGYLKCKEEYDELATK